MPKSTGISDGMEKLAKALDRSLECETAIRELNGIRVEIERAIEKLESPTEQAILRFRYINGFSWGKISNELHFSFRHVTRSHSSALENLEI